MSAAETSLFSRFAMESVATALKDTPVVLVNGPRQCGKTTLVRELLVGERTYITLDDETALAAARSDPTGFVRAPGRMTIDEIQRAPELLRAIKRSIDDDRRPGRFLITGSADVLSLPQVSESLAGRMAVISLMPLSRAEIRGRKPAFLERAFNGKLAQPAEDLAGDDLVRAVLTGGYPEMVVRKDPERRLAWGRNYVNAIVRRDVRDIADIEKLDRIPRLLRVLAHQSGQLTNFTQAGGRIGLDDKTTRKYITILEQVFLVRRLEPWLRNRLKRLVRTPKLHFLDSGLLAAISGVGTARIAKDRTLLGPLLESFAFSEIVKQAEWFGGACTLYHYRDKEQEEVDIVIEHESGAVIGVELKASATVTAADFKGLKKLAAGAGREFRLGVVLHDGKHALPFGDRLWAAPVQCLWE